MTNLANGSAEVGAAAGITADIHDRADPRLVLADRVEQLYSQLPLGMVATLVIGVIAAVELREGRFIELVLFWGTLLAAAVGLFLAVQAALLYSDLKLPGSGLS